VGAAICGAQGVAAAGYDLARGRFTVEATMRQIETALAGLA